MKKSIKVFLASILLVCSTSAYAQKVEEVTLTVSGDGPTKKEATEVALRSAIEQAFGVFVSANTVILNDKLVKDEIATVASGNIKKYEEIVAVQLPNGNTAVTLKAVVSVSKLISYAQSKGASAEFAGETFGMNMKLKELNKANEEKAIANMIRQLKALAPTMFDYKLELGEPTVGKDVYHVPATVYVLFNDNTEMSNNILLNTLASLSLTKEEREEYKKIDIGYEWVCSLTELSSSCDSSYYLRSSKSMQQLMNIDIIYSNAVYNFKITDNTGGISFISYEKRADGQVYGMNFRSYGLIRHNNGWYGPRCMNQNHRCDIRHLDKDKDNIAYVISGTKIEPGYKKEYDRFTELIEEVEKLILLPSVKKNKGYYERVIIHIKNGDFQNLGIAYRERKKYLKSIEETILNKMKPKDRERVTKRRAEEQKIKGQEEKEQYAYYAIELTLAIPKDDISKYSNFTVSPK
jgi:hypothetical protein